MNQLVPNDNRVPSLLGQCINKGIISTVLWLLYSVVIAQSILDKVIDKAVYRIARSFEFSAIEKPKKETKPISLSQTLLTFIECLGELYFLCLAVLCL